MAVVFDETAILNNLSDGGIIDYNAISGGPEGSTTIVSSPFSGVSQRNVNRLDRLANEKLGSLASGPDDSK